MPDNWQSQLFEYPNRSNPVFQLHSDCQNVWYPEPIECAKTPEVLSHDRVTAFDNICVEKKEPLTVEVPSGTIIMNN